MKRWYKLTAAVLLICLLASSPVLAADSGSQAAAKTKAASKTASVYTSLKANLNGTALAGTPALKASDGTVYFSVDAFAKVYGITYKWEDAKKSLSLKQLKWPGKYGKIIKQNGIVLAPLKGLTELIGGKSAVIGWSKDMKTVQVTLLPAGTVQASPSAAQLGERWALPASLPQGPVYRISNGKLIFLEYAAPADTKLDLHDIPGSTVPVPAKINHVDIAWSAGGNDGNSSAQVAFRLFFISRAEQNAIAGTQPAPVEPVPAASKSFVALGDSITYGYNLVPDLSKPAAGAFPFLTGAELRYNVTDLAKPGATSADLLQALSEPETVQALSKADLITLDIGSNDLLKLATQYKLFSPDTSLLSLSDEAKADFAKAIQTFSSNLPVILEQVQKAAPNAQIVLINLYNPIPADKVLLHSIADQFISSQNETIAKAAASSSLKLVDAYSVFKGHADYIISGDVHPTAAGHKALAKALNEALTVKASK